MEGALIAMVTKGGWQLCCHQNLDWLTDVSLDPDISLDPDVSLGLEPIWSVPDLGLDSTPIQDTFDNITYVSLITFTATE
eukprot:9584191-Ditylum_brightwellii.AAC.1